MLIRQEVIKGVADSATREEIDTQITLDGSYGWRINSVTAFLQDIAGFDAADGGIVVAVRTEEDATVAPDISDTEVIAFAEIGMTAAGTPGNLVVVNGRLDLWVDPDRVTVKPRIYCYVGGKDSSGAIEIPVTFLINYEVVKLSQIEMLRLQAAGS